MAKKIVIISFGDSEYDGRLRALMDVFSSFGDVYGLSRGRTKLFDNHEIFKGTYLRFIWYAVRKIRNLMPIDMLVLDNRKACVPGLLIKLIYNPFTIVDCRELYLLKEVSGVVSKIGCIFEKITAQKSDVVICANSERAEIMKQEYTLDRRPIVYENLRMLHYDSENERLKAEKRLKHYVQNDDEVRIVSSSGCAISRLNDVLVKNLPKVNHRCRLFLVGDNTREDEGRIKELVSNNSLLNVEIVGRLKQSELKYLIEHSHIGIVNYNQKDTNNKYCASGKVYEFLYEGIPVVTTTNPPLSNLCNNNNVGIADDEFYNGINRIIESYDVYKEAVKVFIGKNTIEENDARFIRELKEYIV